MVKYVLKKESKEKDGAVNRDQCCFKAFKEVLVVEKEAKTRSKVCLPALCGIRVLLM
jgi:hypothetical protein